MTTHRTRHSCSKQFWELFNDFAVIPVILICLLYIFWLTLRAQ